VAPSPASRTRHHLRNDSLHPLSGNGYAEEEYAGSLWLDPMRQPLDVPGVFREGRREDRAGISDDMKKKRVRHRIHIERTEHTQPSLFGLYLADFLERNPPPLWVRALRSRGQVVQWPRPRRAIR